MTGTAVTYSTATVVAAPSDDTETVIAVLNGITPPLPGQILKLYGWVNVTPDASATNLVLGIRQDNILGNIAGVAADIAIPAIGMGGGGDTTTDVSAQQQRADIIGASYVLTVTMTAAGGATTVNACSLTCRCD